MITCPNCNHQNPEGALQCEACYTPLPALASCPNCNATIQADASFCGQCGSDLRGAAASAGSILAEPEATQPESSTGSTLKTQNFLQPDASENQNAEGATGEPSESEQPEVPEFETFTGEEPPAAFNPEASRPLESQNAKHNEEKSTPEEKPEEKQVIPVPTPTPVPSVPTPPARAASTTQLQTLNVRLRHVQTSTPIEIPRQLSVVRIGKPNEHTPPDIDVSGFPDSEIVSRVHANLRAEGDTYYLEDVGSSNGTYINGLPLPTGNRHRLRPGDRIALGKGDKVSFIFESSS